MKHDPLPSRDARVEPDEAARRALRNARLRAALRLRGLAKLALVTIAGAHLLTLAFDFVLVSAGFAPEAATLLLFRFASCALVSYWLQADALRAYRHALEHGFIAFGGPDDAPVRIAPRCPKHWLVCLNLQLDPHWIENKPLR
ncbi:hypothetical protein DF107_18420 [Burkholderia stagnalis]|uniref:hypothetical protein n=1 Tax=Burkholderia stagnalis TaxID=1503054 RepID=UPI000F57D5BF|nr:hypothetical protein [Burkholderia stagnalis]RQQ08640.1 hypothetical protein DF161_28595 [Burkholderia stagnalis]RQQ09303.1 hypothetical protein DF164_12185 [Burkholderia stagnalis]RQQ23688.1 hypothetical protein DF163_26360 [Burkholderia stagnalis]RQQ26183.1 hypothetical protein DF149_25355 [Burkholderia stagnalis]RQQ26946.1 hypothetical protein DF148_28620 [Burkholderia stagnalis]